MKKLGIAVGALTAILVVVGLLLLYPRIREWELLNRQHDLRVAIAQRAYLEQALQSHPNEPAAQVSAVVGASVFEQILRGAKGLKVNLPSAGNATIELMDGRTDFQDAFPLVTIHARATRPDIPNTAVKAAVTATLAPVTSEDRSARELGFRVRLIDVEPEFSWTLLSLRVPEFLHQLAKVKLVEIEDALPVLKLPIRTDLSFQLPGQSIPTRIPNDDGWIDATAHIPPVTVHWSVALQRLFCLSDGVHIGLNLNQPSNAIVAPKYSLDVPSNEGNVERRLREERSKISLLRGSLQARFGNEKRSDSDLSLHASPALFTTIISGLNSVSPPLDISLGDVSEHGYIKQAGGSSGYYVELLGRNDLQATTAIRNFRGSWTGPGNVAVLADFALSASAQIAYHVQTPVGGVDGSAAVNGKKAGTIMGTAIFTTDGRRWPDYEIQLIGPPTIEITLNARAGRLGEIGVPVKFNMPVGSLVRGNAPGFFSHLGFIEIHMPDGTTQQRAYQLSLEPHSSIFDQSGFSTTGRVKITWQQ